MLQFSSVSNSLSHTQPFLIKREVYFFKEVFARLYSLRQYVFCMYMCIVVAYDNTTASSKHLSFFSLSFSFTLWSARTTELTIR